MHPIVELGWHGPENRFAHTIFDDWFGSVQARSIDEVVPAIDEVETSVRERRLHAAGFVSYEAASGFDSALATRPPTDLPLVWFGLFRKRIQADLAGSGSCSPPVWVPSVSEAVYESALARIAEYISAGDTYQVNYTIKLRAAFQGQPLALYRQLCRSQGRGYCGFVDTGAHTILSASPEQFFSLEGGELTARPMKGTRKRGRWLEEDAKLSRQLATSSKERAENVMIADLLRNDLGRVSQAGSVAVPSLWEVEKYETVWQMTSTVRSRLRPEVGLSELFAALFPCGSVTGAPKVRTMEIIAELENEPRGVYTGCVGYVSPDGPTPPVPTRLGGIQASFNVAIRTISIDQSSGGQAEFGVGGGVTHYSTAAAEYEECMTKARVLSHQRPDFSLLETLLFEAQGGYFLLERHLARLEESAHYFGIPCDTAKVRSALEAEVVRRDASNTDLKVRLTMSESGKIYVVSQSMSRAEPATPIRVAIAAEPVDDGDPFLYHKTTNRRVYEDRLNQLSGYDDVLLYNQRGELTECCIGNVVVERNGEHLTPRRDCGLLAGTYRAELLESDRIREAVIGVEELYSADSLFMINSVRRWVKLELVGDPAEAVRASCRPTIDSLRRCPWVTDSS